MIYFSAAYTLWTSREDSLAVSSGAFSALDYLTLAEVPQQHVTYPQWKACSGFKVAAGSFFGHDGWEVMLQYTWFYNLNNRNKHNHWTDPLIVNFQYPALVDLYAMDSTDFGNPEHSSLSSASYVWNNQFNRFDLILGRNFFAGHYLLMKPFVGFMGWIDFQVLRATYRTQDNITPDRQQPGFQTFCAKEVQNSWGVGPYIGTRIEFLFYSDECNQFGLFGDMGAALPWATFYTKIENIYACNTHIDTEHDPTKNLNVRNQQALTTFMVEVALGFRWTVWICDEYLFGIQVAWENQLYRNYNHMYIPTSAPQGLGMGEFVLQGLTAKITFGF